MSEPGNENLVAAIGVSIRVEKRDDGYYVARASVAQDGKTFVVESQSYYQDRAISFVLTEVAVKFERR